jgi:CheY-like chemotaxis protein
VFTNLLNNASKYTDSGGRIELAVTLERDGVVVTIRDNGIGIPPDRLESVFEMFSQVETAISRSRGGLGIGLSLTQRLVQMHGGIVRAYSDGVGQGSKFLVVLPLARAGDGTRPAEPEAGTEAEAEEPTGALRLLVVDDNLDAAETLAELLGTMGYEVRQAGDGEAALKVAEKFAPHVVLLDIGLPGMNGYDVCRRMRQQRGGKRRTMVAITGWGQPEDLKRSKEAGFDRHLVKPMDFDALVEILKSVPEPAARRNNAG